MQKVVKIGKVTFAFHCPKFFVVACCRNHGHRVPNITSSTIKLLPLVMPQFYTTPNCINPMTDPCNICHINGVPFTINKNPRHVRINLRLDLIGMGAPTKCGSWSSWKLMACGSDMV